MFPLLRPEEEEVEADHDDQHRVAGNAEASAGPGVSVGVQTIAEEVIEGSNVLIEVCREPGLPLGAGAQPVPVILQTRPGLQVTPDHGGYTL